MLRMFSCGSNAGMETRDVPDIRFRFLLAGYPAVFFYPVPAPVPAEMVPGTGYLYRIVQCEQTVE